MLDCNIALGRHDLKLRHTYILKTLFLNVNCTSFKYKTCRPPHHLTCPQWKVFYAVLLSITTTDQQSTVMYICCPPQHLIAGHQLRITYAVLLSIQQHMNNGQSIILFSSAFYNTPMVESHLCSPSQH